LLQANSEPAAWPRLVSRPENWRRWRGPARFSEIIELRGRWLPGAEGAGPLLLGVRETARYLAAAGAAGIPYHRLEHLRRAEQSLQALDNRLLSDRSDLARALPGALDALRQILGEMRREAESAAALQIPTHSWRAIP